MLPMIMEKIWNLLRLHPLSLENSDHSKDIISVTPID
jgi:hypothetical protein